MSDWRCIDTLVPEDGSFIGGNGKLGSRAPSETDSVINGDQGMPYDSCSDSSIHEDEIVPQLVHYGNEQSIPARGASRSRENVSASGENKPLKRRPKHQRLQSSVSLPVSSAELTSSSYQPRYVRGDLDQLINLLESSC